MHQHRTHLRSISFFALAALALVATSCRKEAETFKNPNTCHATSFTQQFERYEQVPSDVAQKIIAAAAKDEDEDED